MQTYRIEVLQHIVEYTTEDIVLDESAHKTVYDWIVDEIEMDNSKGKPEMMLEDENENPLEVTLEWKIINPWKEIAGKLYYALITETAGNLDREDKTIAAIQEYELLKDS